MAEPGSRVLRVRRTDADADSFVLLNVTTAGTRPLDLKVVGTDGEDVYVAARKFFDYSQFILSAVRTLP